MASSDDDVILIESKDDVIVIDDAENPDLPCSTSKTEKSPMECPICLQTCIHPAKLPCGHIFCFLCVKGVAYKNRRCAMCRREIPPEFLDHPQLVHGLQDLCKTKATEDGYQWFYEGRNGGWWEYDVRTSEYIEEAYNQNLEEIDEVLICGWWQYDERTSQDIEDAYKVGEKSCTILVAGYVYVVDFEGMLQQRQNDPSRRRHVKRDLATIPKKGVAGLRIDGSGPSSQDHLDSRTDLIYENNQTETTATLQQRPINFISTIAATDAAIRIASDIIDSTLAHADELTARTEERIQQANNTNNSANVTGSVISPTVANNQPTIGNRELLQETEEFLEATQVANIASTDTPVVVVSPSDLFTQTLDDFRSLTLRNVIDTSDSEDENEQIIL